LALEGWRRARWSSYDPRMTQSITETILPVLLTRVCHVFGVEITQKQQVEKSQ